MKYYFTLFVYLLITCICGCDSPKPRTFADAATECRQAVNVNDFSRARTIVDSLSNTEDKYKVSELKKEVIKKEILYIFTEMSDEDMLNAKIQTFLEEDSAYATDALRIALNAKKIVVAKNIVETYFWGKADAGIIKFFKENDVDFLITYIKSLSEMSDELLIKLLDSDDKEIKNVVIDYLRNSYIKSSNKMGDNLVISLLDSNDKRLKGIAMSYLRGNRDYSSDMLNLLAKQCDKQYNNLLMGYLTNKSSGISGKSLKAGIHYSDSESLEEEYEEYISSIKTYNSYCRSMVDCAVDNHNLALAKESLRMFRKNMHARDLGAYKTRTREIEVTRQVDESGLLGKGISKLFGSTYQDTEKVTYSKNKYKITWNWVDRDEAKNALRSAQNEGAFKR